MRGEAPGLTRDGFQVACRRLLAFVKIAAVLVLVLSLGLHWALLQTVAWTGMLLTYSRGTSLSEAVTRTFDGRHPCALCKFVQKGRAEEKKQEQQQLKPGSKLEYGLIWQQADFNFASAREEILSRDTLVRSRLEEPPKPRPRGLS
jgi:hypothetical protein